MSRQDVVRAVAKAIWLIRREEEDMCDRELDDLPATHPVWDEARAACAAIQPFLPEETDNHYWGLVHARQLAENYRDHPQLPGNWRPAWEAMVDKLAVLVGERRPTTDVQAMQAEQLPGQIWITIGADARDLDGCYFETASEAATHGREWGGKVARYIQAEKPMPSGESPPDVRDQFEVYASENPDPFDLTRAAFTTYRSRDTAIAWQAWFAAWRAMVAAGAAPAPCTNCDGSGLIGYTSGQTAEQFEQGVYPCPECAEVVDVFTEQDGLPQLPEAFEAEFATPGASPVSVYTAAQMKGYARAALAARKPVGEVIEYQSYHGYGGGQWSTCDKKLYDNGKAFEAKYGVGQMSLYRTLVVGDAAPPAQGIDLEPFRKPVERWRLFSELGVDVESMPMHFQKSPEKYAADVVEADRLLGLINGHVPAAPAIDLAAIRTLVEAVELEFCGEGTEANEPDDSKVSYPEETCPITFGMIRAARRAIGGQRAVEEVSGG